MGKSIEILKGVGLPVDITAQFNLNSMRGSHIIDHTRMAKESAVTIAGSHPFSTGMDLCSVHNGSLSNKNTLRENLAQQGIKFETDNYQKSRQVILLIPYNKPIVSMLR
jgi:amidophosphoribosyltransferase